MRAMPSAQFIKQRKLLQQKKSINPTNEIGKYPFLCGQESKSPVLFISYRPIKQNSDALTIHIFKTLVTFRRRCKLYNLICWMNISKDG